MAEEKKQQTPVGLLDGPDTEQERVDESDGKTLIDAPKRPPQKHTSSTETSRPARKRKRPTKVDIDDRNRMVAAAAIEFQARYKRLPTVGEIAAETRYSRRQIYSTTAYKEGRIARKSSKSTSDMMGGGVDQTRQCVEAELDDIQKFIRDSTASIESKSWMRPTGLPQKPSARRNPMLFLVNRPSWWQPPLSAPLGIPAVLGLSSQQPYIGGVIVDYSTDSVYIGLARPSALGWFKQKLPFI